ncbi:MAG: sialidase family protein [Lentisphaeria bacterium]|jgi:hypothetical protein|nr:sialidase family protein [Lentisphaeria bacterium]
MAQDSFAVDTVPFGLARFGFVERNDGSFLALVNGWLLAVSNDRGRSWSEPQPLLAKGGTPLTADGKGNASIIRLASGKIGIQRMYADGPAPQPGSKPDVTLSFATSDDEGRTWSGESRINRPGTRGHPYHDVLTQTGSGRLILPVRACYANRSELAKGQALGTVNGHQVVVEGHAHYPEIDVAFLYYSDDQGLTWHRAASDIIGWPDDGRRGAYAVDEPTVAQAGGGRILMLARSTLGRVIESWSDDDGGTWTRGLPNELCNSYSPVRLRTIPSTGDLHCAWNQVTPEEVLGGYRRSRLTSAISGDGGKTWEHFTTLDCADPLDKSPVQKPGSTIGFVVSRQECGELPDNFCIYRYPNIRYAGDTAYISHDRETFKIPGSPKRQHVLRAIPIDWLYDDSRSDLSLSNDVSAAAAAAAGEDIED